MFLFTVLNTLFKIRFYIKIKYARLVPSMFYLSGLVWKTKKKDTRSAIDGKLNNLVLDRFPV